MTTSRRSALGLLGATSVAAAGALATRSATAETSNALPGRVPKGLRPGGELDQFIAQQAAKDAFSGGVLITHRGRTVLARSAGMADKARSVPNGPDTLFNLASVAKVFTGVAIARLAQLGKLRYYDPLGKFVDGFPAEIADRVTIHHMVTHTSGLGDFRIMPGFWEAARTWTTEQQVTEGSDAFVRKETLAFPPGAGSQYSNSAYYLLGQIITRASGQKESDFLRDHIFRAAGMDSTGNYTLAQWRGDRRIAHPYWRPPGSEGRVDSLDEQMFTGGQFSTCAEMERFAHALWEEKLLNPAYTRLVLSGKVPQRVGPPPGSAAPPDPPPTVFECYGPGATLAGDHWSYGHNGAMHNGASTQLEFYPDSGYVTVYLSNYAYEAGSGPSIPSVARRLIIETM